MWLEMLKKSEGQRYGHGKHTKATIVNLITAEKKGEFRILVAMSSCSRLVKPLQHGIVQLNLLHQLRSQKLFFRFEILCKLKFEVVP